MFGWIGNLFIVGGLWGIGSKVRNAFLLSVVGESLWMVASYQRSQWDLMVICGVFCALAVRSYVKWGQEAKPEPATEPHWHARPQVNIPPIDREVLQRSFEACAKGARMTPVNSEWAQTPMKMAIIPNYWKRPEVTDRDLARQSARDF